MYCPKKIAHILLFTSKDMSDFYCVGKTWQGLFFFHFFQVFLIVFKPRVEIAFDVVFEVCFVKEA